MGDAIVSLLFRFIRHKDVCRAGPVFVFAWPDDINTPDRSLTPGTFPSIQMQFTECSA